MSASAGPRIAFAIPYYDHPGYLAEAVASVRAQTVADWELVVVDDAGPEPVGDLVAAYDDPRIRYLRNEANLGLVGNWNRCLDQVGAPLVTLLHGDDRLRPGYAAAVLDAAARAPGAAAYFTDVAVIGADGTPTSTPADLAKRLARRPRRDYELTGDQGLAALLRNNYVYCPTLCLDRAVVGAGSGEDVFDPRWRMVADLEFTTRQMLDGRRLHSIRAVHLDYRRHTASQTETLTADATRFREELALYRQLHRHSVERGWQRSAAASRRRTMVRGHLAQRLLADLVARRTPAARAKWDLLRCDLRGGR